MDSGEVTHTRVFLGQATYRVTEIMRRKEFRVYGP